MAINNGDMCHVVQEIGMHASPMGRRVLSQCSLAGGLEKRERVHVCIVLGKGS